MKLTDIDKGKTKLRTVMGFEGMKTIKCNQNAYIILSTKTMSAHLSPTPESFKVKTSDHSLEFRHMSFRSREAVNIFRNLKVLDL